MHRSGSVDQIFSPVSSPSLSALENGGMHRLSSLPGADTDGPIAFVEQPSAAVMFLTSASSDISALARVLDDASDDRWVDAIRALPLDALTHPAQIDH